MHENGKSRSSFEVFCHTERKNFLGTTSKIQNVWDLGNFFAYHGFRSIFLSHSSEKLREDPSNVSESFKWQVSIKVMQKNGVSRLSVENFLSQSAEKFRWGTLRYIRKVRLSKNFMHRRVISLFSVEFFSRLLPIKLGWESLFVSESLGHRRLLCSVAGYRDSPLIFFDLTVLKNFVRNPNKLAGKFDYRIFLCMRTENHVLHSKCFVSQYAKNSWERLLRFKMFGILETSLHITVFPRFFCLTVAKNFVRNHLMFLTVSEVRYRENLCKRTEYHDFQSKIFCLRLPKIFFGEHFGISKKFGFRKISCLRG